MKNLRPISGPLAYSFFRFRKMSLNSNTSAATNTAAINIIGQHSAPTPTIIKTASIKISNKHNVIIIFPPFSLTATSTVLAALNIGDEKC